MEACYECLGCNQKNCMMYGKKDGKHCWEVDSTLGNHYGILPVAKTEVFKGMDDAILVFDERNRIIDFNTSAETIIKTEVSEDIVKQTQQVFKKFPVLQRIIENMRRSEVPIRVDGQKNIYDVRVSKLLGRDGNTTGRIMALRDITARKRAIEAILESEEKFKFLAENMGDIVWTLDIDFNTTYVSPSIETVLGLTPEEHKQQKLEKMVTPESLERITAICLEELQRDEDKDSDSDRFLTIDVEYYHRNGSIVWLENNVKALRSATGTIVGMYGVSRDITERKRMEQALKESEEKYRTILETIEDSYLEVDLEGNFQFCNNSFCELLGCSKDELRGRNNMEFMDKANAEKVFRIFHNVYETKKPVSGTAWEYIRKDGTRRYGEASISLIVDAAGKRIGFRGIGRDVTERKNAENAILQAKEEWEQTFHAVPDLISILDNNHRIVRANKAMADRLETTPEALVGQTCYEIVHGTDEPPLFCPHSKLLIDAKAHSAEVFEEQLQGDFMVTVNPIYHKNSEIGCVHVARDITQRKQMEETLRKSEQRFRFLFQSTLDCVVILDRNLNYIYANQAANTYLGLIDDTIEGKNLRDALAPFPEFRDQWIQRLKQFFKSEKPRWAEDSIKIGTEIAWSESSLAAIRDTTGQIVAIGIIYRDISKRKQMAAERDQLITDLQNALDEVKTLHGLLPICSSCKKIRDDKGYWNQIEGYVQKHSEVKFSHGICPECAKKHYPDMDIYTDLNDP